MQRQHFLQQLEQQQVSLKATVVRLTNTATSADHLVTVVETRSGDVVGSFTMLRGTTEFLEKNPTQCVFAANAAVKGAKVGFTA